MSSEPFESLRTKILAGEPVRPATQMPTVEECADPCPCRETGKLNHTCAAPAVPDAAARAALKIWEYGFSCETPAMTEVDREDIEHFAALIREAGEMRPAPKGGK